MEFKVEAENGLFDIYEVNEAGKHTVMKGEFSLSCSLVSQDKPLAEVQEMPSFEVLAVQGVPLLKAA